MRQAPEKYIITNFAYGTGSYLRTAELALAMNDELEMLGKERLGIVVPLVYGEKQKKVMLEEFSFRAGEIFFDGVLGKILGSIFYGGNTYEEALAGWVKNAKVLSAEAHAHLSGKIKVFSLTGEEKEIDGTNIVLEISRSPRLRYDIAPAYFTTFGYVAEILANVRQVSPEKI